jgi:dephospho-CoA kinase
MMQPGQAVYAAIVERFGSDVVTADGSLDRRRLSELAFNVQSPRVAELNAIVHPAVLAAQAKQVAEYAATNRIVVIESALIFTAYGQTQEELRKRFDCIVLVTAPESEKIKRFIARMLAGRDGSAEERDALEADARRRLATQNTESHAGECFVVRNDGDLGGLDSQINVLWDTLSKV